jgi:hypothetical protein
MAVFGMTTVKRISIIDAAFFNEERGEYTGMYSHENLEDIGKRYANVQMGEWDEVYQKMQDAYRHPPTEITKERFWDMLECLPPVSWVRGDNDSESFKMSERTIGNLTGVFVRRGKRYFELTEDITKPHAEIMAIIDAAFAR